MAVFCILAASLRPMLSATANLPAVVSSPSPSPTSTPVRPTNTPRPTPNLAATREAQATATVRFGLAIDQLPGQDIRLSQSNGYVRVSLNFLDWTHYYEDSVTGLKHSSDVWVSLVVENLGGQTIHTNPFHFTMTDNNSRAYEHSSETYRYDMAFTAIDLQPRTYTTGGLIFELALHTFPSRLIYDDGFTPPITLDIAQWLATHEPRPTPTATPVVFIDVEQSVQYSAGLDTIRVTVNSLQLAEDSVVLKYSVLDQNYRRISWWTYDDQHGCGHIFELFQDDAPLSPLPVPNARACGRDWWINDTYLEYFSPLSRKPSLISIRLRDGYVHCLTSLDPIQIAPCQLTGYTFQVHYSGR